MNILSVFDGISCGQVALNRSGIKYNKYFASEIEKDPITITMKHFPDTIQLGDVTKVFSKDLPKIDLLMGGFPCQSFSSLGDRKGFEDSRGQLFFECTRLLEELKPKYFLFENVRMNPKIREQISEHIGVTPTYLCSSDFSAQKRKRYYWTNIPIDMNYEKNTVVLEDILDYDSITDDCWLNQTQIERGIAKHSPQMYGKWKMGRVKWPTPRNEKSKCLNTARAKGDRSMTHIEESDGRFRLLSIDEYEKLQTLPLGYTEGISRYKRYKAIGNGWNVDTISHIFKGLK